MQKEKSKEKLETYNFTETKQHHSKKKPKSLPF